MSRVITDPDSASLSATGHASYAAQPDRERSRLTRAGIAVAAVALLAWAFAPFILTAVDAARNQRIFTGVAGFFPWDGLQYLAFVRDGHDGLIRNLFGLSDAGAVFVHPLWSLTGIVQGVTGVGPVAITAFWKVVGAAVLLAGAARLVARHIPASSPGRRTTALGLCLFGGLTPVAFLWTGHITDFRGASIDLIPAATLWDYAPMAIAIGLMPFAIEGVELICAGKASRRTALLTAACCLIVGWLRPWQGATLMFVWLGLLVWRARDDRSSGTPVAESLPRRQILGVLLATSAPLAYYVCLSRIDVSWAHFSQTDGAFLMINLPVLEYCVAPLVVVAVLCTRALRRDRSARILVLWALATLAVVALRPPEQYHALDGLVVPLGVLVVRAWPASRALSITRLTAIAAIAAIAATFASYAVGSLRAVQSPLVTTYSELAPSDVRAVTVAARADGGQPILSPAWLGSAIPMLADAPVWVGNRFWTPNGPRRIGESNSLFVGSLTPEAARRFVRSTRARALIAPCGWSVPLEAELAPLGFREQAVGCAHVYLRAG